MGISQADLQTIIRLKKQGYIPSGCSVAEIGSQQLSQNFLSSRLDIELTGSLFGASRTMPSLLTNEGSSTTDGFASAPLARDFWIWLGLDYTSIDIDGSLNSIPLDLNYDDVPAESPGRYQLVTNFGTTEHIANQLNAFKIIHDLTAKGGIMFHDVPSQGMLTHGFYGYTPQFFWMLVRSNGYRVLHMELTVGESTASVPSDIVETLSRFAWDHDDRFSRYKATACGLMVALEKQFDLPFAPPLDVPTGARLSASEALRTRYRTSFDPDAFLPLEQSLAARRAAVMQREQELAHSEEDLEVRKRSVYEREQDVARGEEDLEARKRSAYEREQYLAHGEEDIEVRKRSAYERERDLAHSEEDLEVRKRSVYEREQDVARGEEDLEVRKRSVYERELAAGRFRRWAFSVSPQWVVSAKRRIFGINNRRP